MNIYITIVSTFEEKRELLNKEASASKPQKTIRYNKIQLIDAILNKQSKKYPVEFNRAFQKVKL